MRRVPLSQKGHAVRPIPLFLHLPKTAGTTLKHCIYEEYARHYESKEVAEFLWENQYYFWHGVFYYPNGFAYADAASIPKEVEDTLARRDITAVTGHFKFGLHKLMSQPTIYLTLLREPIDRVVSLYHHVMLPDHDRDLATPTAPALSLEDFVCSEQWVEASNDQTRRIAGDLGTSTCRTLARAKNNLLKHFAVVGVTHRFDETLILMRRVLGWADVYYLPDLVNSQRTPRDELAPALVTAIADRNQLDNELFRFAEELLDSAISKQGEAFAQELELFRVRNRAHIARWSDQEGLRVGET